MKELFAEIPTLESDRLILRKLTESDADALQRMVDSEEVYRYLPTFLFEKKYDVPTVIRRLYDECLEDSLILGIFQGGEFCGLAEMYAYRKEIRKISIGCRLVKSAWGRGVVAEALRLMVRYLHEVAGIEIITASSMVDNAASAQALRKNGFELVAAGADEDWGFEEPTKADKWIL